MKEERLPVTVTITYTTRTADFDDPEAHQRILAQALAKALATLEGPNPAGPRLLDQNGNTVGSLWVERRTATPPGWAIPYRAPEPLRARLKRLAKALGQEPTEHVNLERYNAHDGHGPRWWLTGCKGGDTPLPRTTRCPTANKALDVAEAWLAPELDAEEEP